MSANEFYRAGTIKRVRQTAADRAKTQTVGKPKLNNVDQLATVEQRAGKAGNVAGLSTVADRAAMAEELDWDLEGFDKAFGEVFGQGMAKVAEQSERAHLREMAALMGGKP